MKRIVLAIAAALTMALFMVPQTAHATGPLTPTGPYYFKDYYNYSWCITDLNDGGVGTHATMQHCSTSAAGQEITFVQFQNYQAWNIKTDNGLCLEDPNGGGDGTWLIWDTCTQTGQYAGDQIWSWFDDPSGIPFWVNNYSPGMAIGLYQSNPYAGAKVQAEPPHFNDTDTDQDWCVTNGSNQKLVC